MRPDKCAKRYKERTFDGKILPTKEALRDINVEVASTTKPPLLIEPPSRQSGEPLHESAGCINHFLENVRTKIREWESNGSFMLGMRETEKEVKHMLDQLSISVPKEKKNDPQFSSIIIPLHNESKMLRRRVTKVLKQVDALNAKKVAAANSAIPTESVEVEVEDEDNEVEDEAAALLDLEIVNLREEADELWQQCKDHAMQTNYGHYVQLQIGLSFFYSVLLKML